LHLVEQFFRATKSLLDTRLICHQCDATIRGHVFCSFLALVLLDELQRRLRSRGWELSWSDIRQNILALAEVEVRQDDQWCYLRTALQGCAGKVLHAVGASPQDIMRQFLMDVDFFNPLFPTCCFPQTLQKVLPSRNFSLMISAKRDCFDGIASYMVKIL